MGKRGLTQEELNVFEFLNDLRDSSVTNMFGASPYLEDEFGFDSQKAITILSLWMTNFHEDKEAYKDLLI